MGKVKLLDKHTAELIAAGEVVERPSSVIKELAENSIDAFATKLTVEIKNGGVTFIRISDNGCGIASEDVATAFLRHATSKISTGEDLAEIATLGFRGEALASISAVCRVEMITRASDAQSGLRYVIEGGEQLLSEETGCAVGTTIIIRDIFFNTPARMKFLKKDVSEGNSCAAVIDRLALSHPEIMVCFIRDGKEVLRTPGDGKLKSAIHAVFGREFAAGLLPVSYSHSGVSVRGYISKPVNARPNRSMQVFFINGRYVRSKTMQAALEEGCKGAVMIGKYPSCVLGIELNCAAVDVNVHPAKLEVRFTNERPIFEAIYYGVKSALSESDVRKDMVLSAGRAVNTSLVQTENRGEQAVFLTEQSGSSSTFTPPPPIAERGGADNPSSSSADTSDFEERIRKLSAPIPTPAPTATSTAEPTAEDNGELTFADSMSGAGGAVGVGDIGGVGDISGAVAVSGTDGISARCFPTVAETSTYASSIERQAEEQESGVNPTGFTLPPHRIAGEIFKTYIIAECENELILIDKHAAHERLIYERLMGSASQPQPQLLLSPITVALDKLSYDSVLSNEEVLEAAGFEIEDFGTGTILVRAVPMHIQQEDVPSVIEEIAGNLGRKVNATLTERLDRMYQTIACKAAIRAGDRSTPEELAELVLRLSRNTDVRYCPHGRPIFINLKRSEIEKNFGR
ncbi:MAG: DNA mismatch repair endonuclease MutL [Oscillospiraceae bacterium]|jgi:DNA mismatch repair protein MutL|nr:DNA mismatch repair endonuclease MutL [Oscillospiraceae bacterium]